jgi:hypothetical protein
MARRQNWHKKAADEFANMNQDYQNSFRDLYMKTSHRD